MQRNVAELSIYGASVIVLFLVSCSTIESIRKSVCLLIEFVYRGDISRGI